MEVEYQPDTKDYYLAQQYISRSVTRDSFWRFAPTVIGGMFGLCFALGAIMIGNFYDEYKFLDLTKLNWGMGLIAIGFFILFFGLRSYNNTVKPRMFSPEGLYRSPHKINLANDNIVITVKNNKYTYAYSDVLKVENDNSYVYVFVDSGAALYIPEKAFSSAESRMEFINELKNKINRWKMGS